MSKITGICLIVLFSWPQMEIQFLNWSHLVISSKEDWTPTQFLPLASYQLGFVPLACPHPRTGSWMEELRQERSSSPHSLFFTSSSRLPAVQHLHPILPPGVEQMGNDVVSSSETSPHPSSCLVILCSSFLEEGTRGAWALPGIIVT